MPVDSPYPESIANETNLPDVVQYVDKVEASHMNNVRAFIRDMTSVIGTNPQGTASDLVSRLNVSFRSDGMFKYPQQIVTVAKSNAPFTSVQSAIDSITDQASDKRYTIMVYPGVYEENITLKKYVDIVGASPLLLDHDSPYDPLAIIQPSSGACITLSEEGDFKLANLYLQSADQPVFSSNEGVNVKATNCRIRTTSFSTPALSDTYKIGFVFRDCTVGHVNSSKPIIQYTASSDRQLSLTASRCYIEGILDITESTDGGIYVRLHDSYWKGKVISNGGMNMMSLFYSTLYDSSQAPIQLNTDSEVYLDMAWSTVCKYGSGSPITRLSTTNDIHVKAAHCMFNDAFETGVVHSIPDTSNVYYPSWSGTFKPL